jgi:hypothetical protein
MIPEGLDYICAERLTPSLASIAEHLAAHSEVQVTPALLEQLEHISVSTVRRSLKAFARQDQWQLPRRKGPRPPHPVTRDIPMKRIPWDEREPGHFETDLLHHCGPILSGDYLHAVQMTDVATSSSRSERPPGRPTPRPPAESAPVPDAAPGRERWLWPPRLHCPSHSPSVRWKKRSVSGSADPRSPTAAARCARWLPEGKQDSPPEWDRQRDGTDAGLPRG